jgi:hypothetical protein
MGDLNKILVKTLYELMAKSEKLIKELEAPELTAAVKDWMSMELTIDSTERAISLAKDSLRGSDMFEEL